MDKSRDKPSFAAGLRRERVLIQTEHDLIEGTLCYPRGLRISDALNATANRDKPYLALVDATVSRIGGTRPLFRSRFLLVARTRIVVLLPKSELVRDLAAQIPGEENTGSDTAYDIVPEIPEPLKRDVPALVAALKDADASVRRTAAEALGMLGAEGRAAIPGLVEALKDEDELVRGGAAEALGAAGPEARVAVPALINALRDPQEYVRRAAAGALGNLGAAAWAAVTALTAALKDKGEFVRRAAAEALGKIGPEARPAEPALQLSLQDNDVFVRHWASVALKQIRSGNGTHS